MTVSTESNRKSNNPLSQIATLLRRRLAWRIAAAANVAVLYTGIGTANAVMDCIGLIFTATLVIVSYAPQSKRVSA